MLSIYNIEHVKNSDSLHFTVEDDLFLEVPFLRIRGETIKFSSMKKNRQNSKEKELIHEIQILEECQDTTNTHNDLLEDKKQELEDLRKEKVKGQVTKARLQWLNEGEKATNFFCKLEQRRFVEKTIKKLNYLTAIY